MIWMLIGGMVLGYITGRVQRDYILDRINRDQQLRGDYWFERCQELAKTLLQDEMEN